MRVFQEITERIRYVERFEVLVSGQPIRSRQKTYPYSDEYPFSRAANRQMPVSKWLEIRFKPTYPGFHASVIYPNGSVVRSDIPIGIVRDAYESCSNIYGQSMQFEFWSYDQSLIIDLKDSLAKAGIETKFESPSILFLWQWHRIKGKIIHIHLPFCYRKQLPDILKSFSSSQDSSSQEINFQYEYNLDNYYLFKAESKYSYFGMTEFQLLKSFVSS